MNVYHCIYEVLMLVGGPFCSLLVINESISTTFAGKVAQELDQAGLVLS